MKRLRINDVPILNILDLRSMFSPPALYQELETFEKFAAVHCVPLPLHLVNRVDGTQYCAECLTKEFWHKLLSRVDWPEETLLECLGLVLDQELDRLAEGDQEKMVTLKDRLENELADAALAEKLNWIMNSTQVNIQQTMVLLAICELAEIDPRKTAESDWYGLETDSSEPSKEQRKAELFPYEGTAYLTAGNQIYKYWCYERETLEPGAMIQTVRLEAKACNNLYAGVRIEIYSDTTGMCVQHLTLSSGEFRYCTVCQGRVIRFLPNISVSDDLCLFRYDCHNMDIQVLPKDGEAWQLNGEHVSCFSAGKKSAGFLLVQDGKVNANFYRAAQGYATRLQLDMIMSRVIEARVWDNGYELLLEDGTTATNLPSGSRTGVLTLTPPLSVPPGVREISLSQTGQSAALLMEGDAKERVFFSGVDKSFHVLENGTIVFQNQSEEEL